jgi:hypothetical protein
MKAAHRAPIITRRYTSLLHLRSIRPSSFVLRPSSFVQYLRSHPAQACCSPTITQNSPCHKNWQTSCWSWCSATCTLSPRAFRTVAHLTASPSELAGGIRRAGAGTPRPWLTRSMAFVLLGGVNGFFAAFRMTQSQRAGGRKASSCLVLRSTCVVYSREAYT